VKKALCLLILFLTLCVPARASVVEALEPCRTEAGLLPDMPGGGYSAQVLADEMKLRLLLDEKDAFAKLYQLMVKYFQAPMLLLYRRLDASLKPTAYENDIAVELQMCRVLLEASRRWQITGYRDYALKKAARLLRYNVYRSVLINSASWKERPSEIYSIYEPSHILDLASVDVQALQILKSEMPERWVSVAQRCLGILLAGSGSDEPQLCYDVDRQSYVFKKDSLAELKIMENLVDGGLVPLHSMDRLIARLKADPKCLATGEDGSLAASALAGYVLSRAGFTLEAHGVFAALEETFGTGEEGLLHAPGKEPSIPENLIYMIEMAKLAPERLK
jgi:hypothetical protein